MSNETAKCNKQFASERSCPDPACSVWEFKYCSRSDCEIYKVRYRAFDIMDAYAQFESDIDPDDVSWVEHSQN